MLWYIVYLRGRFVGPVVEIVDDAEIVVIEAPMSRQVSLQDTSIGNTGDKKMAMVA